MAVAETGERGSSSSTPLICRPTQKLPLVDKRGGLNVERRGLPQTGLYWGDLFHTLVNLPNLRFFGLLFCTYFLLFVVFAIPYYYEAHSNFCIPGVRSFSHAVWFSVQTSMTIGYGGELTPDPRCLVTNSMVLIQSIASLIVAYSLLGIFYARFSRPTRRAQTLIFSRCMVLSEEDGVQVLALRMANIRKHQVIEASVRMLVALNNSLTSEDESVFNFMNLPLIGGSQIFLGLPCVVKHPITASSPLYGLSLQAMEDCDMEVLVLLEGVDASTSCKLQARHSYRPADICTEARFETMVVRLPSGRRCVDFSKFDSVVRTTENLIIRPGLTPLTPSAINLPTYINFSAEEHKDMSPEDAGVSPIPERTSSSNSDDSDGPGNLGYDHYCVPSNVPKSTTRLLLPNRLQRSLSGGADRSKHVDPDPRVAKAEAKAQIWKQMVVELAVRVQQAAHQQSAQGSHHHLHAPLMESAKQALIMALASDST